MRKDIKKKFIDILFEPEENESEIELYEEPAPRPKAAPKVQAAANVTSAVNARDFLYKKGEQSAFIDLDPPKKNERKVINTPEGEYEFSSQISPIFGVIKENEYKMSTRIDPDTKIVNKPDSSHLEIITSPIYGYARQSDIEKNDYNEYFEDTSEQELHELLDKEEKIEDDHTYDDFGDDEEINLFNYRED
ncbi:MAG: hypothetical protein J6S49_09570 [Erysipelotrichaceae bacterium]|nr:hypothetical protein [Erysipelotrichaceae bacterium]MBO7698900.1 hypothetical protein [Erysipelotrichaceae bacterium]MBP5279160.1 hypothetical protein [Erysipelotrichaceae bacterium]